MNFESVLERSVDRAEYDFFAETEAVKPAISVIGLVAVPLRCAATLAIASSNMAVRDTHGLAAVLST